MRTLLLAATITMSATLPALAQTAAPSTPPPGAATITAEGCVTRQSAPSMAAAEARDPQAAMQYVLTDRTAPAPLVPDGSARPTPAPGGPTVGRRLYVLAAQSEAVDFAKHLNHMVRVTGATTAPLTTAPLAGRSPQAVPVSGTVAPAGATGTAFDTTNVPTLTVTSLSMVAATCR